MAGPKGKAAGSESLEIKIEGIDRGEIEVHIVGDTPMLQNRMAGKASRDILYPRPKKRTDADRAQSLKHDPTVEFPQSLHLMPKEAKTLIGIPGAAFKGAMCTAALDTAGAKKAQIGRLVQVVGDKVEIYGLPKYDMREVRQADINHTPDIRTRAILPEWAAVVRIRYVEPNLKQRAVANLFMRAGVTSGVGDGRPEKGKLDFGQWRVVSENDPDFRRIVRTGGRVAQERALADPQPYNEQSEELWTWFQEERKRREDEPKQPRGKKAAVADDAAEGE